MFTGNGPCWVCLLRLGLSLELIVVIELVFRYGLWPFMLYPSRFVVPLDLIPLGVCFLWPSNGYTLGGLTVYIAGGLYNLIDISKKHSIWSTNMKHDVLDYWMIFYCW